MRVDQPSGLGTVLGVPVPGGFGLAASTEAMPVLGIDQFRQRVAVGFIPDVGGLMAVQLGIADAGA